MNHTKINPKYLDSSCRELFVRGLGFFIALSAFWGINFSCACTGCPIQLYKAVVPIFADTANCQLNSKWMFVCSP